MNIHPKDIAPYNKKGQAHGLWVSYWGANLWYTGVFHNNLNVGYWETYHIMGSDGKDGELQLKTFYIT